MNKRQLRDLMAGAIQYAHEKDAQSQHHGNKNGLDQYYARRFEYLNHFMVALRADLGAIDPELGALLTAFHDSAVLARNPLLDAADNNKEPR